jgi:hypothetical protein
LRRIEIETFVSAADPIAVARDEVLRHVLDLDH